MAGWFPGVPRFVLISRLAVCVQSELEDDYTLQQLRANNTIATRYARAHTRRLAGARESAAANTSFYQQIQRAK